MRGIVIIFLLGCIAFSCVKPNTKDPVPAIEFKGIDDRYGNFWSAAVPTDVFRLPANSNPERDTAALAIGYQDGDGDLFADNNNNSSNFVWATYYYNTDSSKFLIDGSYKAEVILQPADGYYKGKSIQGVIYRPMKEFRTSNHKILRFEVFMVDLKDHKSNVLTSPVYTLN